MHESATGDFNQLPVLTVAEVGAITAARDAIGAEADQLAAEGQDMGIPISAVTADGTFVSVVENRSKYGYEGWMTVRTGSLAEMASGGQLTIETLGQGQILNGGSGAMRWRGGQGTDIVLSTGQRIHWSGPDRAKAPTFAGSTLFPLGEDDQPIPLS